MKKNNKIINLATGVALGGMLGILFAPKSGIETRRILKTKFREIMDKVKKTNSKEIIENIDNIIYDIKLQLDDISNEQNLDKLNTKIKTLNNKVNKLIKYVKMIDNDEIKQIADEIKEQSQKVTKELLENLKNNEDI